jgi:hypothetical protein
MIDVSDRNLRKQNKQAREAQVPGKSFFAESD